MLILSRKLGESIVIDGRIIVKIMRLDGDHVKLGIEAPVEVPVHRREVYLEIQKNNQEAITGTEVKLPRLAAPSVSAPATNHLAEIDLLSVGTAPMNSPQAAAAAHI